MMSFIEFISKCAKALIFATSLSLFSACGKFIEPDAPTTQITPETVFQTAGSASSALSGIYSLMMTNTSFTSGGLEEFLGIASDELINYSTNSLRIQFYQNSLTSVNADVLSVFWGEAYKYISNANMIVEGLERSTIPEDERNPLLGEALFVRAFCYYYLVTLFGDIPYLTTTDYEMNAQAPRTPATEVLTNIASELTRARELMSPSIISAGERVRPGWGAATALLGRVYLHQHAWKEAEAISTELIGAVDAYTLVSDLSEVFKATSSEAIWQLMPVVPESGTPQAYLFLLLTPPNGFSGRVSLSPELMAAFESGDLRKSTWTRTLDTEDGEWYYPYKYTTRDAPLEYSMIFRLAEQYLIRAEARAQLGNFEGAREDINAIRGRAGLNDCVANDQASLESAILKERRIELMAECGHRWIDLQRMGVIDDVLSGVKPNWQSTDALFPIPESERLINGNLSQNPGY